MSRRAQTILQQALLASDNQLGMCVVTLLAWIATSDGRVSEEEQLVLEQIAEAGTNSDELRQALTTARAGDVADLQLACEICRFMDAEQRHLFLRLAIGIAAADGYLTTLENQILRFLADLMDVREDELDNLFREVTNRPLPPPGDPSSIGWWEERERARRRGRAGARRADGRPEGERTGARPRGEQAMGWREACAILGLGDSPDQDEIRAAYRRLAKAHHPDRFARLGPEAVKAAALRFRKIRQAYEALAGR